MRALDKAMIDYCILTKRLQSAAGVYRIAEVQRWVDGGWRCVNMRCRSALPCLACHVGLTYGARTVARQAAIDMGASSLMQQGGLLITPPIYNSQGERCGLIRRLPVFVVIPRWAKYQSTDVYRCGRESRGGWARVVVVVLLTEHVTQANDSLCDCAADGITD